MREFPVETAPTSPGHRPGRSRPAAPAEAVRAEEPAAAGHLARPWRPVGEPRGIGVWRADDGHELHEKVLDTLPLRPWTTPTATAPESRPHHPGRTGAVR